MAISRNVLIVKYHAGDYGQWITLANVTNNDINLRYWKIREYKSTTTVGTTWTFPWATVIKAKSLLIVRRLDGSGIIGVPPNTPVVQTSLGPFGLTGEKIVLLNPNNQQVDELIFSDGNDLYYGNTPFQIFIPPSPTLEMEMKETAFLRRAVTDTDSAADWQRVRSSTPIPAWQWAPLTDYEPPVILSITPADGAANVEVGAQVKVMFNEPIFASTALQSVTIKDANNIPVGSVQASVTDGQITIAHASFNSNTFYTVNVPAQAVKDAGGNPTTSAITWSFKTIIQSTDTPAADKLTFINANPRFAQVAGQDGAVEANAFVKIYGSPAMDTALSSAIATATGSFGMMFNNSSSLQTVYVTAAAPGKVESSFTQLSEAVAETGSVLIVKYRSGVYGWITLANVTNNDINLTNWKMSEYLDYRSVGSTWTFPSGTVIKAKSLLIVSRPDSSVITDAPADIPVVETTTLNPFGVEQEKIILLNSNNIQEDELIFQTEINFTFIWYYGITPFQIYLYSSDPPLTTADVFVRKSVTDTNTAEDWNLVRSDTNKAWEWTPIKNSDTTPPDVVLTSPANDAANVALNAPLIVKFNEPILEGSLINGSSMVYCEGYLFATDLQGSVSGSELLIAHPTFTSGCMYFVTVPVHAVTDTAGNPFVNPIGWSFTTGYFPPSDPPVADKISFINCPPEPAKVSGQDGAVEPNSEVSVYSLEDYRLGTTFATATGSFELTIDTTVSVDPNTIYIIAWAPGKDSSPPINLIAECPISG